MKGGLLQSEKRPVERGIDLGESILKRCDLRITPDGPLMTLTGDDHVSLGAIACFALKNRLPFIMLPAQLKDQSVYNSIPNGKLIEIWRGSNALVSDIDRQGPCEPIVTAGLVGQFSSGSTRPARLYLAYPQQVETTAAWYEEIYKISRDSLIITALPSTYNFPFFAGVALANRVGCLLQFCSPQQIPYILSEKAKHHDRVVLLANPVTLSILADNSNLNFVPNLLIDSGGAPLSTYSIQWFRAKFGDVREGYGLTETCSLTHFDSEGTQCSMGSVGRGLPGVETRLRNINGADQLEIRSANVCEVFPRGSEARVDSAGWLLSEDLGKIDQSGRLFLLGRNNDVQVGGLWPREALNLLGDAIGPYCCLIKQANQASVSIALWRSPNEAEKHKIEKRCREVYGQSDLSVQLIERGSKLTHSMKLKQST